MDTSLPVTIAGLEFSKVGRDALGRKVFGVTLYGHRVAQAVADIPFGGLHPSQHRRTALCGATTDSFSGREKGWATIFW